MRVLFDTSIFIAGFVASHPKHHHSLTWLQRAKAKEISLAVSAHSIAECFAVLTRLPLSPRITTEIALYLIRENIESIADIIALSSQDYLAVVKRMAELGLSGGIINDAITIKAGLKTKATKILTLNPRDFIRLSPEKPTFILPV